MEVTFIFPRKVPSSANPRHLSINRLALRSRVSPQRGLAHTLHIWRLSFAFVHCRSGCWSLATTVGAGECTGCDAGRRWQLLSKGPRQTVKPECIFSRRNRGGDTCTNVSQMFHVRSPRSSADPGAPAPEPLRDGSGELPFANGTVVPSLAYAAATVVAAACGTAGGSDHAPAAEPGGHAVDCFLSTRAGWLCIATGLAIEETLVNAKPVVCEPTRACAHGPRRQAAHAAGRPTSRARTFPIPTAGPTTCASAVIAVRIVPPSYSIPHQPARACTHQTNEQREAR